MDISAASTLLPGLRGLPDKMEELLASFQRWAGPMERAIDVISRDVAEIGTRLRISGASVALGDIPQLSPPVVRPGVILTGTRTFHTHHDEMVGERPLPLAEEPVAFLKSTNSAVGNGESIILPRAASQMVDFGGQFAVVFARPCHGVTEVQAMAAVAGYTILNDICARDWAADGSHGHTRELNQMGRQFPTFSPVGPMVVTKDEIPDPHDVVLSTTLNGKQMQSASTSDLYWPIPYLISYLSRWYSFMPGDILATGTPSGVGYARSPKVFLRPGDMLEVSVSGTHGNPICKLANPVRSSGIEHW